MQSSDHIDRHNHHRPAGSVGAGDHRFLDAIDAPQKIIFLCDFAYCCTEICDLRQLGAEGGDTERLVENVGPMPTIQRHAFSRRTITCVVPHPLHLWMSKSPTKMAVGKSDPKAVFSRFIKGTNFVDTGGLG